MTQTNPLIKGLISGTITYYIEPLPPYASADVSNAVDQFDKSINGVYEPSLRVTFQRTYDQNNADIQFSWIKNYGSQVAGESIVKRVLKIGLGSEQCGDWQPFDAQSVLLIMVHELGHSLGYGHSSDPNNVMYATTDYRLSVDYDKTTTLDEGEFTWISFCRAGTFSYTVSSSDSSNGFLIYVLTPQTDPTSFINNANGQFYPSCSGKESQAYSTFSGNCVVPYGAKLLLYNKNDLLKFNAINVSVRIVDENQRPVPELEWDKRAFEYDDSLLNEVWNLYH